MKIVWSARAVRHLVAIRTFIAEDNPKAVNNIARRISDSVEHLAAHPHLGRGGRIAGTRELVIPDTPYVVPYRIHAGRLEIIAIFHGRQMWPDSL